MAREPPAFRVSQNRPQPVPGARPCAGSLSISDRNHGCSERMRRKTSEAQASASMLQDLEPRKQALEQGCEKTKGALRWGGGGGWRADWGGAGIGREL